jgi:hypothetical protein
VLGQFPLELYDGVSRLVLYRNDVVSSSGCLRGRLINQEMGNIRKEMVLPFYRQMTFELTEFLDFSIL